ncbi:MAG: hypothetical protein GY683_06995, partial [Moraxella sp.]|nr:hypothetical protein [Moraxella sp.]
MAMADIGRPSVNRIKSVRTAISVSVLMALSSYASAQVAIPEQPANPNQGANTNGVAVNASDEQLGNQSNDKSTAPTLIDQKTIESAQLIAEVPLYTPAQIEARLQEVTRQNTLMAQSSDTTLISRIDQESTPMGLDVTAITKIPTPDTLQTLGINEEGERTEGIDPTAYIPEYEYVESDGATEVVVEEEGIKRPNVAKRLYNRLFNDGVEAVARVEAEFYQNNMPGIGANESRTKVTKIDKSTLKQEPFANIKAALEDITAESITDFNSALPRLRQTADSAARAVGYYDVDMQITKVG